MENTFLIINNGLTILLLQAKGSSGALFRKKISSLTFFFSFYKRKAQCSFQIFTMLDYFSSNYPVC